MAEKIIVTPQPIVTKVLMAHPVSIPGGVWTFFDTARDACELTAEAYGVRMTTKAKPMKPARNLLIPWSNITGVLYAVI